MKGRSVETARMLLAAGALLAGQAVAAAGAASAPPKGSEATGWEAVDAVFGAHGKGLPGGVEKYGWPRSDLVVRIGEVTLQPALALGSWAGFLRTGMGSDSMAMGDLVLLDSEVTPILSALEASGFEVTAIHNHLLGETPHVTYLHYSGRGEAVTLAKALRAVLEKTGTPIGASSAAPPGPEDVATLKRVEEALGRQGSMAGPVLQIGVPRAETIREEGMEIPASDGMANSMNFQVAGRRVATTGDFVLLASEVNPVIRELRAHGIEVTALHSHMLAESPRLFFMHFWAVDSPDKIGQGLKAALAKVHTR